VNGYCNPVNETCYCFNPYFGEHCDQKCIDLNCSIPCSCNDSISCQGNYCMNDIVINNQSLNFSYETQIIIKGNITIEGSNIILTSTQLTTDSNVLISNSNIYFNLSTIISKECINLSNTTLTVDLSNVTNQEKLYLLNSTSNCLKLNSYSISYLHQPKCTTLKSEADTDSLYIIFQKRDCSETVNETPFAGWELALIIIGIIVLLLIIVVIVVLAVPSLRKAIFPHRKKNTGDIKKTYL